MTKVKKGTNKIVQISIGIFLLLSLGFWTFFGFSHFMSNEKAHSVKVEENEKQGEDTNLVEIENVEEVQEPTPTPSPISLEDHSKEYQDKFDQMEVVVEDAGSGEIKKRMDDFIEIGSYFSFSRMNYLKTFMDGKVGLDHKDKLRLTYQSLLYVQKIRNKVFEVPNKYRGTQQWIGVTSTSSDVFELPIVDFKNEYERLFHEEVKNFDDLVDYGCPFVYTVDEELGNIYMLDRCGGTGATTYLFKNVLYRSDEEYYYVEQKVGSFAGASELEIHTITWVFDHNGDFVRSSSV